MTNYDNDVTSPEKPVRKWKEISWQVLLVGTIAGSIFLPSGKELNTRRPVYNSLEECISDWNNTSADCESREELSDGSSNSVRLRRWYGPDVDDSGRAYHADGRITEGHTRFATSSFRGSIITRGGFGSGFSRGG